MPKKSFKNPRFKGIARQNVERNASQGNANNGEVLPNPAPVADPPAQLSTSQKKIRDEKVNEEDDGGSRLVDFGNLVDFLQASPCAECFSQEGFNITEWKSGLASILTVECKLCGFERTLKTSKEHVHEGTRYFENNTRLQAGTLAIGKNYHSISKFLAYLNLRGALAYRFWLKHLTVLNGVYKEAAEASMQQAAQEEREQVREPRPPASSTQQPPEVQDIICSFDGTWQRRGFSSHNGVCTALTGSGKKVIDVEVKSNFCQSCTKQKKALTTDQYERWQRNHIAQGMCDQNHTGSAGSMEPQGMLNIFRRSVEKRKLRYVHYLGDGDSKTFKFISEADPPIYPGTVIDKLECTGHVQKRAKNKLTARIQACSNMQFIDDLGKSVKGIGGKKGITEWHARRIQGHYGAAIRKNAGNLEQMTQAVWSIYWHRRGDHSKCSTDCPAVSSNDLVKANVHGLPNFVMDQLKPVFDQLADRSLLQRCVHGGTQNSNEAFHHLIWERCPKTVFANLPRLSIAVNDAIVTFNDGEAAALDVLKRIGIQKVGTAAEKWARSRNMERVKQSVKQSTTATKAARKRKSSTQLQESDKRRKVEGVVYSSGAGFN
jgi:hypothetical protein